MRNLLPALKAKSACHPRLATTIGSAKGRRRTLVGTHSAVDEHKVLITLDGLGRLAPSS